MSKGSTSILYIDKLDQPFREHIENIINTNLSAEQIEKGNKICYILLTLLSKKKVYNSSTFISVQIQIVIAAAYLSQLVDAKADWRNVFNIRSIINAEMENDKRISPDVIDTLNMATECQLGADMPVIGCRPYPNTPDEVLALSITLVENENITITPTCL